MWFLLACYHVHCQVTKRDNRDRLGKLKYTSLSKWLYIIQRKYKIYLLNMALISLVKRKIYISFEALPLMKYKYLSTSLDKTSSPKGNDRSPESHYKSIGTFRCSRAADFTVSGPINLKFQHIQNILYVLIACKFKKYLIDSNRKKVKKTTTTIFRQGLLTLYSLVGSGRNSNSAKLTCMLLLHKSVKRIRLKTTKKLPRKGGNSFFCIVNLWGYL